MLELLESNKPAGWPEDLPARSYLYSLEPMGLNGATREDLRSYFQRLCVACNLAPWSVADKAVAPLVSSWRRLNTRSFVNDWFINAMSGFGQNAADWSRALNLLTGREDLQYLTLIHLQDLLSNFLLASKCGRYCPQCYAEDVSRETDCYNRLLWTFDIVKACPIHELELMEGCSCGKSRNTRRKCFVPGRCPYCAQNLSQGNSRRASSRDVDAARRVAELLDVAQFFEEILPEPGGVAQFLRHAIATLAQGVSAHLASALGVTKSSMHGWQNGHVVPSFPVVLRIAQYCNVGISDVLLGNELVMSPNEQFAMTRTAVVSRAKRGPIPCRETVSERLQDLITRGEAIHVNETARILGVSDKFLRERFPDAVETIVQNGRHLRRTAVEARAAARTHAYLRKRRELVAAGSRGSRREVVSGLRDDGIRMSFHEAGAVHRLALSAATSNE